MLVKKPQRKKSTKNDEGKSKEISPIYGSGQSPPNNQAKTRPEYSKDTNGSSRSRFEILEDLLEGSNDAILGANPSTDFVTPREHIKATNHAHNLIEDIREEREQELGDDSNWIFGS